MEKAQYIIQNKSQHNSLIQNKSQSNSLMENVLRKIQEKCVPQGS